MPRWVPTVLLALATGALLCIHLELPGFFDNEGRYAEVAREMLLRGDFVTPTMDFTLFLNKPPLLYWLVAAVFSVLGPSEWARLVTVLTSVVMIVLTGRLGARLYDEATGFAAAAFLATTVGFVIEARTLRPDSILVTSVVGAVWCWIRAEDSAQARGRWLVAMYAILGIGVLAKGLVPVLIAGVPIVACTVRDRGLGGLLRLRPGLGLVVGAIVVLPWHVLVSIEHPGFAWDYIVNQHLLFFLDKKFPRDSEGDTLAFFWASFVGRSLPWILLLPFGLREAWNGRRSSAPSVDRSSALLGVWIAGVLFFFSLAPSRLEHYSLPAMPAAAILSARVFTRLRRAEVGAGVWYTFGVVSVVLLVAGVVGVTVGPSLLERVYWLAQEPRLIALSAPAGAAALAGGVLLAWGALGRRATIGAAGLAVFTIPLLVIGVRAEVVAEPLFSWKPVGEAIKRQVPADVEIVFESPEEYQLVGGLVFYTGRPITMIEPANFVPPTYLESQVKQMFLARSEFDRRWTAGIPLAFVSDPQRRRESADGLVPGPVHVLGRFGDRWILTNVPLPAPTAATAG
jgi:4-amino-4-deoxy-L-arabinose transferase-like glycosyltransferase